MDYFKKLMRSAEILPNILLENPEHANERNTFYEKLLSIHLKESNLKTNEEKIDQTSNLLEIFMDNEKLNYLTINLYPNNEGFSVMLKGPYENTDVESIRLSYENCDILNYIDNQLIPPMIIDLIDNIQANFFQSGFVLAEICDYRYLRGNMCETQYVLLKPSYHTLLCDLNSITSDTTKKWNAQDKFSLESQLLNSTSEPLCLNPSPIVFHIQASIGHSKRLARNSLKCIAKKNNQVEMNRRELIKNRPAPNSLRLVNFLQNKNKNCPMKKGFAINKFNKPLVDYWRKYESYEKLSTPVTIEASMFAIKPKQTKITIDNTPVLEEEYVFETDRGNGKVNMCRLTVMQRLSDGVYTGSLLVDRDFKEGSIGSKCKFVLGTYNNVEKYVRQFKEIFTEEGRRQVKITHIVPGKMPQITFTQVSEGELAFASSNIPPTFSINQQDIQSDSTSVFTTLKDSNELDKIKQESSLERLLSTPSKYTTNVQYDPSQLLIDNLACTVNLQESKNLIFNNEKIHQMGIDINKTFLPSYSNNSNRILNNSLIKNNFSVNNEISNMNNTLKDFCNKKNDNISNLNLSPVKIGLPSQDYAESFDIGKKTVSLNDVTYQNYENLTLLGFNNENNYYLENLNMISPNLYNSNCKSHKNNNFAVVSSSHFTLGNCPTTGLTPYSKIDLNFKNNHLLDMLKGEFPLDTHQLANSISNLCSTNSHLLNQFKQSTMNNNSSEKFSFK